MNEDDSDSYDSDTEQEDTMAGPSADPRGVKGDAQEVKPVSKNEMVSHFAPLFMTQPPLYSLSGPSVSSKAPRRVAGA